MENENLIVERQLAPVFPEDLSPFQMEIIDIKNFDRPSFNDPDVTVPSFRIEFKSEYIPAGEEEALSFVWFIGKSLSTRSNLYKLAKAALGKKFDDKADAFDAGSLIGKKVRLILKTQVSGLGREYSKATDVLASAEKAEK
jgi:hypothetical protein